jgi:hypothetical protein
VYKEYKQSMSFSPALPMLYILFRTLVSIDTHTHTCGRAHVERDLQHFAVCDRQNHGKKDCTGAVLVSVTFESLVCCMPPDTLATLFGI